MAMSRVVTLCQICGSKDLKSVIFLGFLPPVNKMRKIGQPAGEELGFPAELLVCPACSLAQLGLIVDATVLFPPEYPYTSSTTRILRENFAELNLEVQRFYPMAQKDLIVDIGSNDGNLLSNFKDHHQVLGVTPEEIGKLAIQRGIPTIISYFNASVVQKILQEKGHAKTVTATNVFAHMDDIHGIIESIKQLLTPDGLFVSESHYLGDLLATLQYDTIYHEHMRYYSLHSLKYLLERHGLEVIHARGIPTHGGSIRVYAAAKGLYPVQSSVSAILEAEKKTVLKQEYLDDFRKKVGQSKLDLIAMLRDLKNQGKSIAGISAPSRASTLINYTGLDETMLDCVYEISGSHKIGNYIPGKMIPILDEKGLYETQPDYALIFSWHIASELMPRLRQNGFKGDFIIPLPNPEIVLGAQAAVLSCQKTP